MIFYFDHNSCSCRFHFCQFTNYIFPSPLSSFSHTFSKKQPSSSSKTSKKSRKKITLLPSSPFPTLSIPQPPENTPKKKRRRILYISHKSPISGTFRRKKRYQEEKRKEEDCCLFTSSSLFFLSPFSSPQTPQSPIFRCFTGK